MGAVGIYKPVSSHNPNGLVYYPFVAMDAEGEINPIMLLKFCAVTHFFQ
jgi:hypothetical protein